MLFLFSDVGPDNAPTRIKVGSHLDVPPFLAPAGERGTSMFALAQALDEAGKLDSPHRPLAHATGAAGDVYLCHPFLIHAAQPHHSTVPRFMAQHRSSRSARLNSTVPTAHTALLPAPYAGGLDTDQASSLTIASPAKRAPQPAP